VLAWRETQSANFRVATHNLSTLECVFVAWKIGIISAQELSIVIKPSERPAIETRITIWAQESFL